MSDLLYHVLDLLVTGIFASLGVLILARVGLFPAIVLVNYVRVDDEEGN